MKTINRIFIVFILTVAITMSFTACKKMQEKTLTSEENSEVVYEEVEQLNWLIGNWENISTESQSYENWARKNDSTFTSFSYTTVKKDTVFAEVITLQQRNKVVFMKVAVPNQNDAKGITFKLISSEGGIYTFENKNHDFPSRINYSNPEPGTLHAWIEGNVKGEDRMVDFTFTRAN
ncbi:MAG: DUF6265 family protein [Maribacter sp.]